MKLFSKSTVFALLSGIIFLSCSSLFVWDGDPEGPQNVLQKEDSLVVRAILDQNGLFTTEVKDVIVVQGNRVCVITFSSFQLSQLILTRTLDSLERGLSIQIFNCPVESLVIKDTISIPLSIQMNNTSMKYIPDNITLLKGTLNLSLENNKISYIPLEIMKCKVSNIRVDYNNLCSVSDTLNNWIIKYGGYSGWKATQICN